MPCAAGSKCAVVPDHTPGPPNFTTHRCRVCRVYLHGICGLADPLGDNEMQRVCHGCVNPNKCNGSSCNNTYSSTVSSSRSSSLNYQPTIKIKDIDMSLSRTGSIDPFRRAMHDAFDSMERDLVAPSGMSSRFPVINFPGSSISVVSAVPSMGGEGGLGMNLDFHETNKGYELSADLPGMKKEDIKVDIDSESGVLTVTGERKQEREEKGGDNNEQRKYHFVERSYGKTTRSVRLPDTADTSKASAAYVNGVLKLNFPKREPPSARRLQIPIGDGEGETSTEN